MVAHKPRGTGNQGLPGKWPLKRGRKKNILLQISGCKYLLLPSRHAATHQQSPSRQDNDSQLSLPENASMSADCR